MGVLMDRATFLATQRKFRYDVESWTENTEAFEGQLLQLASFGIDYSCFPLVLFVVFMPVSKTQGYLDVHVVRFPDFTG
jgi:hypothetical protein